MSNYDPPFDGIDPEIILPLIKEWLHKWERFLVYIQEVEFTFAGAEEQSYSVLEAKHFSIGQRKFINGFTTTNCSRRG